MHFSLQALAELVGGTLSGDGAVQITGAQGISEAGPGDITFAEDDHHAKLLGGSRASAAVVGAKTESVSLPLICVANPLEAFVRIAEHLQGPKRQLHRGIHPQAVIAATARLGAEPSVGPFVAIGEDSRVGERCQLMAGVSIGHGCRLGDDVVLHPHVVLYPGTVVGHRTIIHAGAVIGADGFGYRLQGDRHVKMPQLGHVELSDDVEIGANTTIDRGTFGVTRIGTGTKIDNLVMVAHNCQIGRHNLIVGQTGIAGSSKTGDYVVIAGHAGIRDHLSIGRGAVVGAMAGVMRDVGEGERVVGVPATPERDQARIVVALHRLPELRDKFLKLTKQVEEIERKL